MANPIDQAKDTGFRMSRWTIRIKLMLVISVILVVALLGMTVVASYFFRQDNILRVQENNIILARVYATSIKSTVDSVVQQSRVIAKMLQQYPQSRGHLEDELFGNNDNNMVFLGVYEQAGDGLRAERRLLSPDFLVANDVLSNDIYEVVERYEDDFKQSFAGNTVIVNVSPGFQVPLVGMSIPYEQTGGQKSILIVILETDVFLGAFQTSPITETFMVDRKGRVVAHPDNAVVLAGADLTDIKIVNSMQTSDVDNGQAPYVAPDGSEHLGAFQRMDFAGVGIIATVPQEKVLAAVNAIQRYILWLLIAVLSFTLIFVFFYARSLSQPILRLVQAAKQIAMGDYAVALVPKTRDEVGLLTNSFNNMSRGLQERENLKDSFGRFVNQEIAEMSMSGNLSLGGERKECAIFFSDIRGFTAMSEKLRPEEVVEFLNEYFTEMVRCVQETNGIVDKFIGDAIMAHWGALKSVGNNTENAINASLMMREALIRFNQGRGSTRRPTLAMGCGINTGPVIAGQIGSEQRLEYTVIGDAVNLASRVEALSKYFGADVIITNNALAEVKNLYKVVELDKMNVKGKAKPITVYAVLGRRDDPNCPKDLNALRKLVGIKFDAKSQKGGKEEVKYERAK